jgi:hypothetical protein
MQFLNIILLATYALLSAPVQACKCVSGDGSQDNSATEACCNSIGGAYTLYEADSGDCGADSISEDLSDFGGCCQNVSETSDCHVDDD